VLRLKVGRLNIHVPRVENFPEYSRETLPFPEKVPDSFEVSMLCFQCTNG
jgi:hypothetical protein